MVNDASGPKKKVAILIEQGVEDVEFKIPKSALEEVGADVVVLGSRLNETYKGKHKKVTTKPDGTTTEARAESFDAVVIPGGMAPDKMRTNPNTVNFVREAMRQNKLVAAVCHGPQVLIEGDLLRGKNATGFISIRKDIENAGANYQDYAVVADGNLITSRRPGDLAIFATAILNHLGFSSKMAALPSIDDPNAEWWKVADAWGGSTKGEIEKAIKTALRGEHYALKAFEKYAQKATDPEIRSVFEEIHASKERNIERLEARLSQLKVKAAGKGSATEALAKVKDRFHSSKDESVLRHAIGDLQTSVVDTYRLRNELTDPVTVAIFDDMEIEIARQERQLALLYHSRVRGESAPPQPTTGTSV